MLLCLFLLSAATFVCGFPPGFVLVIGAHILAGMASGGVVPILFALCGDEVPINERQVAMGRLLFALMTGNLLGSTCAGIVSDLVGWRGGFFVNGRFGALGFVLAMVGFRGRTETQR